MTDPVPDIYADGAQLSLSPFDIVLVLSQRPPAPGTTEPPRPVGYVRMSLEHAKVVSILMRKVLKAHEEAQGHPIVLHPNVYQQMGLSPHDDW